MATIFTGVCTCVCVPVCMYVFVCVCVYGPVLAAAASVSCLQLLSGDNVYGNNIYEFSRRTCIYTGIHTNINTNVAQCSMLLRLNLTYAYTVTIFTNLDGDYVYTHVSVCIHVDD